MKKYILSLVALLTLGFSGVALATQPEGAGANTKREIAGALGYVPYKEYQLVRYGNNANSGSARLSAGDVVTWDCVSDDGVTIGIVSANNSIDAVAGIVVSALIETVDSVGTTPGVDYGRRNWGYMQVRGLNTAANVTGGAPVAGSALIASAVPRYATAANNDGSVQITAGLPTANHRILGFAYDASASGAGNEVMVDL